MHGFASAFAPHAPEGTDSEPGECQSEDGGDCDPACGGLAGVVFQILAASGDSAHRGHRQEDGAGHFMPQLMHGDAK